MNKSEVPQLLIALTCPITPQPLHSYMNLYVCLRKDTRLDYRTGTTEFNGSKKAFSRAIRQLDILLKSQDETYSKNITGESAFTEADGFFS